MRLYRVENVFEQVRIELMFDRLQFQHMLLVVQFFKLRGHRLFLLFQDTDFPAQAVDPEGEPQDDH
ncbi:hypothetical protein D3C86_993730 [compost metagenome]